MNLAFAPRSKYSFLMLMDFFHTTFTFVMFFVILVNIQQRRYDAGERKKRAVIITASLYLATYLLIVIVNSLKLPQWTEWAALAAGASLFIVFRKQCFPFRLRCPACGKKVSFDIWMGRDDNLCDECRAKAHPELAEKEKEEKKVRMTDEEILEGYKDAEKCSDIDWDLWEPDETERCVLAYIVDEENDRMLFIEKLKGMGTGLLNGPGGHIEPEETAIEAAVREIKEETGLDVLPEDLEERAMLSFQFRTGMRMGGHVYYCNRWSGELIDRSDETIPRWYDRKDVDYSRMWEDDVLWLPDFLEGKRFHGRFIFDGQKLIDSSIIYEEDDE